ncbi:MAG: endonuclease YncB(thermonuclease family) [Planctomycetota bacterium]|jgi:endonuclease YncB( thermonuclease family)
MRPHNSRVTAPTARFLPLLVALTLASPASATRAPVDLVLPSGPAPSISIDKTRRVPTELFEVVKIVDGDTIHILRNGQKEKLRLLSVDTEEKITTGQNNSATKPQTVFGEETRLWTINYFEQFRGEDSKIHVGLRFPSTKESYDIYGRLLCHVLTSDGTDFNLLLVQLGKSPYFNKYGNSMICHDEFVQAQNEAQRNIVGVWDPRTNVSLDPKVPVALRPYAGLLPWWQVRADAIDAFRAKSKNAPSQVIAADEPERLTEALASGTEVEIFGTPDRLFDEDDGSRTVLFRTSDKQQALRVSIPKDSLASFEAFDVEGLRDEFRQNYAFVRGVITKGPRGFRLETPDVASWVRAGAEPK